MIGELRFNALMEKKKVRASPFVILLAFEYFLFPPRKAVKEAPANFPKKTKAS